MRCPRCGNDNPGTNRFCGMCGATLLAAPAPAAPVQGAPSSTASVPVAVPSHAAPAPVAQNATAARPAAPVPREQPVISGPSFLGLNEPAPRKRASLSSDPHSAPSSRNLDYLLEDEDEPKRGGVGKFILIVIALALAVGLGYLRFKNQGFGWLNSGTKKPSAAAQNPEVGDSSSTAIPPANGTNAAPPSQPNPAAAGTTSPPAADSPSNGTPSGTPNGNPGAGSPAANSASEPTPPSAVAPDAGDPNVAASSVPAKHPPATKDSDLPDPNVTTPPASKPAPVAAATKPAAPKPAAASNPARADSVSEAQKYLYGKGVPQDCDRGLRMLKPAAVAGNPKAMIEMGALYSAGLCTPRDLPTSYRWFALALRKEPDNTSVQTDLQKLWGEMTQPERQLAIKLSQ
ncbi:MAG TPA: zinc-ribbon domain-containing protein [Candidatus Sulfotelmatobacter sp.]|nr:zinc-ribbon domain-containing protein [Candidatus Sulfotelmatobacter sp.]